MRACYVASYSWHQRRKAAEQESEEGKERTNYDESWRLRKAAAATDKREEEERRYTFLSGTREFRENVTSAQRFYAYMAPVVKGKRRRFKQA
jgi:hypothetical protein